MSAADTGLRLEDTVTVSIEKVAHGGHCVARHEGQVIFVRHVLPGEVAVVRITEIGRKEKFLRADPIEIVIPSPDRVLAPCRYAGVCGGCDWQHVALAKQREMKAAVVTEQLERLAGVALDVEVEAVGGEDTGLHWRTRVGFSVTEDGELAFKQHRSNDLVAVQECVIAHELVSEAVSGRSAWPPLRRVDVAASVSAKKAVLRIGDQPWPTLEESAAGRTWQVTGAFWQVHPEAAETLVATVLDQLRPQVGEHALDLYSGVGLFAGAIADVVGPGGRVDAVESSAQAHADAQANLASSENVWLHQFEVRRFLERTRLRECDLVVLDPPRAGAGRAVVERLARLQPRAVAYVACDPASFARDVSELAACGYPLRQIRAFDLFPMTHHIECVGLFEASS